MRKFIAVFLALAVFTGCTSETEFGECVGLGADRDPALRYEVSGWNIGMGLLFFGLVIPPAVVLANEWACPVGVK